MTGVQTCALPILPQGLIEDNFKILFTLKKELGEKIYNLSKDINKYNSKFYFLAKNKKTMECILKSIIEDKKTPKKVINIFEKRKSKTKKIFEDGQKILNYFLEGQEKNIEELKMEVKTALNDLVEIDLGGILLKKQIGRASCRERVSSPV